jgi:hypothetical protein
MVSNFEWSGWVRRLMKKASSRTGKGIHDVQREDRLIGDQPRQVGSLRRPENSLVDALVKGSQRRGS